MRSLNEFELLNATSQILIASRMLKIFFYRKGTMYVLKTGFR